jgi:hypothetical protein
MITVADDGSMAVSTRTFVIGCRDVTLPLVMLALLL